MKILIGLLVAAFAALDQSRAVFRAESSLVVLHVTVKNARGDLVTDLDRDAFTVYENGKPQTVSLFRRDDVPVSMGLLIDNSGSMRTRRAHVEAAALACVRASNPDDEVFVLNFADKASIDVPFTSDIGVLAAGIARVDSIGGTAMRDAIALASQYLSDDARYDRRALLVITDGHDNASVSSVEELRREVELRGIAIYAIGLAGGDRGRHELEELADATGGAAYFPAGPAGDRALDAAAVEIARQIRHQYTLAYTPPNPAFDGSYRKLRVSVRSAGLVATTRAGYRVPRKGESQ